MLVKLTVKNYALISDLDVDFEQGFNVVTGETGSGKSLLLGALGLLLGQNADFSKIGNEHQKCISEGTFSIKGYNLQPFFEENEIDYDPVTIIRRELNKTGKSRAFINDTPVKLSILKELASQLIDIHSQHENSKLHSRDFMYDVLDTFSDTGAFLKDFRSGLKSLKKIRQELFELREKETQLKSDRDYYEFQFNELSEVELDNLNISSLEGELCMLGNAEEIRQLVYESAEVLSNDSGGALELLKRAQDVLSKIKDADQGIQDLASKVTSIRLELEDVAFSVRHKYETISPDEERLNIVTDLVNQVNTLLLKHRALTVEELIEKKEHFSLLLSKADNFDAEIQRLSDKIQNQETHLETLASKITKKRNSCKMELEKFINSGLTDLSMPQAEFNVALTASTEFNDYGKDELNFLVRTNKGSEMTAISKVASGGEISRVMFLIKAAVASKKSIKTLVLDEIDTGISGEVASKLATQIRRMSKSSQILVVSHLAQMASRANAHYKVSKTETENTTVTELKKLENKAQVLNELAQLLSGEKVTEAALKNAASLLSEN